MSGGRSRIRRRRFWMVATSRNSSAAPESPLSFRRVKRKCCLPPSYRGGSIQRVDLASGKVETVYTACNGHPLRGPNDLVFDSTGGMWFTDFGKVEERRRDRGGIYYARPDGSSIKEMVYPIDGPNGIGLAL